MLKRDLTLEENQAVERGGIGGCQANSVLMIDNSRWYWGRVSRRFSISCFSRKWNVAGCLGGQRVMWQRQDKYTKNIRIFFLHIGRNSWWGKCYNSWHHSFLQHTHQGQAIQLTVYYEDVIKTEMKQMLNIGIIEQSDSPYSFPLLPFWRMTKATDYAWALGNWLSLSWYNKSSCQTLRICPEVGKNNNIH